MQLNSTETLGTSHGNTQCLQDNINGMRLERKKAVLNFLNVTKFY